MRLVLEAGARLRPGLRLRLWEENTRKKLFEGGQKCFWPSDISLSTFDKLSKHSIHLLCDLPAKDRARFTCCCGFVHLALCMVLPIIYLTGISTRQLSAPDYSLLSKMSSHWTAEQEACGPLHSNFHCIMMKILQSHTLGTEELEK